MSSHSEPDPSKSARPKRSKWVWLWLGIFAVAAAGAYIYWPRTRAAGATVTGAKGKRDAKGQTTPVTPVVAVRARKGNIGVYFNGLGSVIPLNTVTVKSRVDGELMSVKYREGDTVHQGDLLTQIDPRPYEVQLGQDAPQLMNYQASQPHGNTHGTRNLTSA